MNVAPSMERLSCKCVNNPSGLFNATGISGRRSARRHRTSKTEVCASGYHHWIRSARRPRTLSSMRRTPLCSRTAVESICPIAASISALLTPPQTTALHISMPGSCCNTTPPRSVSQNNSSISRYVCSNKKSRRTTIGRIRGMLLRLTLCQEILSGFIPSLFRVFAIPPRVTIDVAFLDLKNTGAAMKESIGTFRTIIQGPGSRSAVAA